jgi:hypothetical protein
LDTFGESGEPAEILKKYKLDTETIITTIKNVFSQKREYHEKCLMIGLVMFVSFVMAAGHGVCGRSGVKFWYHFDDPETALNPLIKNLNQKIRESVLKRNALRGMSIIKNC